MSKIDDRIISETTLISDYLDISRVEAVLNGQSVNRILIKHPCGSVVLAYDPTRKVAAVGRQSRLPVLRAGAEPLREPAAGAHEEIESPSQTAIRECFEEMGIRLQSVEFVGEVWMDPSSSTERAHLFLGQYSQEDRANQGGGTHGENEEIDVREEALGEIWAAVERGEPMYSNMLTCLQALRLRHPFL